MRSVIILIITIVLVACGDVSRGPDSAAAAASSSSSSTGGAGGTSERPAGGAGGAGGKSQGGDGGGACVSLVQECKPSPTVEGVLWQCPIGYGLEGCVHVNADLWCCPP